MFLCWWCCCAAGGALVVLVMLLCWWFRCAGDFVVLVISFVLVILSRWCCSLVVSLCWWCLLCWWFRCAGDFVVLLILLRWWLRCVGLVICCAGVFVCFVSLKGECLQNLIQLTCGIICSYCVSLCELLIRCLRWDDMSARCMKKRRRFPSAEVFTRSPRTWIHSGSWLPSCLMAGAFRKPAESPRKRS